MIADAHLRGKMERALDKGVSNLSCTSEAGDSIVPGAIKGERIRKEAGEINIPSKLPTVTNVNEWKIAVASALLQASAYGDKEEIEWFAMCTNPNVCFEDLGNSGGERFCGLDSKLGHAISAIASQNNAFQRALGQKTRTMFKHHKLPTGRHMCAMLYNQLKINRGLNT